MQKIFTLFGALTLAVVAQAQITITEANMPHVGDVVPRAQDTLTNYQPGPSGPNQTWNFPNPVVRVSPTTTMVDPSTTPHASDFTGSNLAMTNDNSAYLYFSMNTNTMYADGAAGDLLMNGDNILTVFNPTLKIHSFPETYGDNFCDNYAFDATADGSSFGVYQVRLKHVGTVCDTIDGWGTITTPTGTYNCLRSKATEYKVDSIWYKPFIFSPSWSLLSAKHDTSISYSWAALETKLAVAELSFDTLGNPKNFTWSLIPPTVVTSVNDINPENVLLYPNPANDFVAVEGIPAHQAAELRIFNELGELVLSEQVFDNEKISLAKLSGGVYAYDLLMNKQKVKSGKLVLTR